MKIPFPSLVVAIMALSLMAPSNDAFVPKPLSSSRRHKIEKAADSTSSTILWYEPSNDPNAERNRPNAWTVLANTEEWMTNTLSDAATDGGNPLSRKEVSYVCEPSTDPALILANMFRKLKEFRELGEKHGSDQEDLVDDKGGT